MSEADKGRPSYLDLLVATLMEHEKDLDRLVEKLEKASTKISAARKTAGSKTKDKPIEKEEETFAGGALVLPETAKEKPQQGLIIAAGPGKKDEDGERIPMDVEEGQRVLYAKYAGTEIKIDGKKLLILKETDILAIVEE